MELFKGTRTRYSIPAENVWNMDETGIAVGVCINTKVLASLLKKKTYIKSLENRKWVLIIKAVLAVSKKLQPLIIFKGVSLQTT